MTDVSNYPASLSRRILAFLWQHVLLIASLYLMTLGVALCVRSNLGSSVISAIPLAFTFAGEEAMAPAFTLGGYTNIMNVILVVCQILVLRRRFQLVQLLQLVIGFLFGALIDLNMFITSFLPVAGLLSQALAQLCGCIVMAVGIAFEVRCGSVTMPGEGISVAFSRAFKAPFPKVKIIVDTSLVVIAVICCYCFWGAWQWNIIGPGTLFAMFFVGYMVRLLSPHMLWFDEMVARPGFRRYIFGLARYAYRRIR